MLGAVAPRVAAAVVAGVGPLAFPWPEVHYDALFVTAAVWLPAWFVARVPVVAPLLRGAARPSFRFVAALLGPLFLLVVIGLRF